MRSWRPGGAQRCTGGREGDSALASFSPRGQQLAVYLVGGFAARYQLVLARLGPHKTGQGCLYLKRLDDVDQDALRELIDRSVRVARALTGLPPSLERERS